MGTPAELRARVRFELYRAWGPKPRAIARAAQGLPYVGAVRASGRYARVEVAAERSPGSARVLADLAALAEVRAVEPLPVDMETTLVELARGSAETAA